ncbi:MAG: penicillin-binding protein 2, partial [Cyanobacteria bacterium J06631_6]
MSKSKFKLPLKSSRKKVAIKAKQRSSHRYRPSSTAFNRSKKPQISSRTGSTIARLFVVWGVLVIGTFGLGAKLYYLQVIDPVVKYSQAPQGKKLSQIATDQQTTK